MRHFGRQASWDGCSPKASLATLLVVNKNTKQHKQNKQYCELCNFFTKKIYVLKKVVCFEIKTNATGIKKILLQFFGSARIKL